ncbi:ATP-dependent DNA helicase [Shewanella litorisediminis]|uniref:DNA 5'-3' helicase n=1 Tax=Shewanella litorisediminis TaxID=1173586 RepID=A0ABX7G8U0_9GAMM|nr:ATP-dependent DNA helicase [Shewanella litorisediminis]MCL2918802.1 ATP-dependent DNA helicase [Shewanella litorisediminis]QRH03648.1 ATP-dependent DNA helicase [Shewanella litorisediminis]
MIVRTQAVFDEGGLLSRFIRGYRRREVQQQMAEEVASCLINTHKLVLEAGTGVGKTFAYLVPALLSGKQVIISTGSKNLQEQLFYKDLPALLEMLKLKVPVSLLKGRSNYLCQRLMAAQMDAAFSHDEKLLDDLLKLNQFAQTTEDGDLGNLTGVAEDARAISLVASTQDSCTGQRCAFYEDCFTRKARARAMNARLIVVNHHLFFADRVLKDTGFAELLPDVDAVIFDEAHLLPDIAVQYFGSQLSTGSLRRLLDGIERLTEGELGDTQGLKLLPQRARVKLDAWQNCLVDAGSSDFRQLLKDKAAAMAAGELLAELSALEALLLANVGRSEPLDDFAVKLPELKHKLERFVDCDDPGSAYGIDIGERHLMLRISPIDIAKACSALFGADTAWVFTSATLQVERSLQYFTRELGLTAAPPSTVDRAKSLRTQSKAVSAKSAICKEVLLDSPFDYPRQSLLCVPRRLGSVVNQDAMVRQLTEVCLKLIKAAKGRTFILFTSHRMMEAVARALVGRCHYPLLVQGQGGKQQLLSKFRQLGEAVLLGTGSFWEGVDVRGKLLSCVIIDKLPFASPDDSLYKARASRVEARGGDPFLEISLPQAVIALKQGAGRLIRDETDRGVLVICDNRLVNRPYGQAFLQSLPPMARTRDLDAACAFLAAID